ncbi:MULTISPECIES: hypothetical protein [Olivibacter]|uniref:Terminase n=1 Tax=Olivibacter jilunii TaxID=985016 RepID=A0ABW6B011_9SPHI
MQLMVRLATQKTKVIEGGRGVGKSTVLADEIEETVHDMPRSTNFLQGVTFQQLLTRTLPSTIASLESFGYKKDVHFVIGKRVPRSWKWDEPYEALFDYKHVITFYTGACYVMLSQDVSSRGINTASGISDEFCLLDLPKFQAETLATLRSQKKRFKHKKRYLSQTYCSSIPRTIEGKFIYTFEEEAKKNPKDVFYIRASSYVNAENLPDNWFEIQRRSMTAYEFDIEIRNIRPKAVTGGFYPLFNEKNHTYTNYNTDYLKGLIDNDNGYEAKTFAEMDCRQDGDLYPNQPLDIALDYGKFCCIVTGQENFLYEFNYLSSIATEKQEMIDKTVERWCRYYQYHKTREVHYWYDQTAVGKDARSPKTYQEIVVETLRANGWTVIEHYYGSAPTHDDKYKFWGIAMRNDHPSLPIFKWNKHNCKHLIESIQNAKARQGRLGVEKDKSDERKDWVDQRTTTHFSDAGDMIAYFKYSNRLVSSGFAIPVQIR